MYSGVERTITSRTRPNGCPTGPAKRRETSGKQEQRAEAGRDQRDLRQHQGLERAGQDLLRQDRPEPEPEPAPGRRVEERAGPERARDDVVAEEAAEAGQPVGRPDGRGQGEDAAHEQDGQGREAHPEPAGADQGVER